MKLMFVVLVAATWLGCKQDSALFCDETTPCDDPERAYCDLEGAFPASEGIGRTCIPTPRMRLDVSKAGSGFAVITSVPAGIDCGFECGADFDIDARITLTAEPSAGTSFVGWGGACEGEESLVCELDLTRPSSAELELCMPKTCVGYCGQLEDGCGGTLDCPEECTFLNTCGGSGVANRCGCTPIAGVDDRGNTSARASSTAKLAQSFRAHESTTLRHIRLYGSYSPSVTNGSVTFAFYEDGGGDPDAGSVLAQKVVPLAESYFTATGMQSQAQTDFELTGLAFGLVAGKTYWLVISADFDDLYIRETVDNVAPVGEDYDEGGLRRFDGAVWTDLPERDLRFLINPCAPLIDWP